MSTQIEATTGRSVAVRYFQASKSFAVIGAVLLALNALQLLFPDLMQGVSFLTYGRVRPMALNAIVFGWLALGLVGGALWVVPRLTGSPLWDPRWAAGGLALAAASVAGGIVAIGAGYSQGDLLFELPLIADVGLFLGLGAPAFVLVRSVTGSSDQPALWFTVAGALWLPLAFVAGAFPGLEGMNSSLQNAFGVTSIVALALLSLALGAAYFVAGELRGSHQGTRVARLGFWSLAFIAAWTAPRMLVFGPAADWLETIAVAFSFVLLIPAFALISDLLSWLAGVEKRRFLLAGTAFLGVFVLLNLIATLRSPSSLTRFTAWEEALLLLPLLGVAGSWLLALVAHRSGREGWRPEGATLAVGTSVAVGASLAHGLAQGITWVGAVNEGSPASSGELFATGSTALLAVAVIGVVVAAVGLVLFGVGALTEAVAGEPAAAFTPDPDAPEPADPIAGPVLVRGAVALFLLAAVSVFLVPTLDTPNKTTTLQGEARVFAAGSLPAIGADLYVSEGCMYCHTQQVRPIITDVGLGAVSAPGDYAAQSPMLAGHRRVGPDLTHIGQRETSTRVLLERLRSPRGELEGTGDGWQIMPSYDYLSADDLLAIAEYLGALN